MNILIDNWCSIICNTDKKVMELLIERHNIVCIVKAAVTAKSVNYAHFWCPNGRLGLSQKKKYIPNLWWFEEYDLGELIHHGHVAPLS